MVTYSLLQVFVTDAAVRFIIYMYLRLICMHTRYYRTLHVGIIVIIELTITREESRGNYTLSLLE